MASRVVFRIEKPSIDAPIGVVLSSNKYDFDIVYVTSASGIAWNAGLRPGMQIHEINGTAVVGAEMASTILREANGLVVIHAAAITTFTYSTALADLST